MDAPNHTYAALRRVCRLVFGGLYRLQLRGGEHVPARGPAIVVANHESVLDPFVLGSAISRELHFLAKAELWRHRPVAWGMDALGAIRIERGRGDRDALAAVARVLEAGQAVAIFPQGAVRTTGPWQRGAARLALGTGAPIVPVRLVGTAHALSRGSVGLPRIRVVVGKPIQVEPQQATIAAAKRLTERLRAAVEALAG
jgi:1-acyl-sn-glycerol-3-phosphate acyltransferase